MVSLFSAAAAVGFALVFLATALAFAQRRLAPRLDATLLFAVLTMATVALSIDARETNEPLALMLVAGTYLQPWLLLRMARHFRPLRGPWVHGSLLLALANIALLAWYGAPSLPAWAQALALGHYAFGNGLAISAFLAEAGRGGGASHQRMAIAAAASAAFLLVVITSAVSTMVEWPLLDDVTVLGTLGMAIGYPLAFAAPRGLRRLWHLATVQTFSDNLHDDFSHVGREEVRRRLHEGVAEALGATTFLLDANDEIEGPAARALQRKLEAYGGDCLTLPKERVPKEFLEQADGHVHGMHVVAVEQHPLVLAILQDRASLFPEEDLELVRLMALQASLAFAQVEVLEATQKDFERAKELETFKSMFLRMVGHELANPLSPVRLQLRILQRQELDKKGKRSVEIIARSVERLHGLISDMSTVAKLQDAKLDMALEPIELGMLVRDACAAHEEQASGAGNAFLVEVQEQLPVRADKQRLGQVLDNLLSNAIKYSPEGGPIHVSVRRRNGQGLVEVKDHGLGLTEKQVAMMFGLYERFHKSTNPKIQGTGLGLAIVKGIVEGHGGTIEVASDGPGKGTTFSMALPLAK